MSEIVYRYWAPADHGLAAGDALTLAMPLPVARDVRVATRNWAEEALIAIWCDEACDEIPAGARFTVAGHQTIVHHGNSALDLELPMLVLIADGTPMGDDAVSRAALMVRLALASGDVPLGAQTYVDALPR